MRSMMKMFAAVVLASAALAACHSKKPASLPPMDKSPETGATGGAAYGGQQAQPTKPPTEVPAKPEAPH